MDKNISKPLTANSSLINFFQIFFLLVVSSTLHASTFLSSVENSEIQQVRAALEAGQDVNFFDPSNGTALHLAAKQGNADIAELLLDNGADTSIQTKKGGKSPLHLAAQSGHVEIVSLLIDRGANIELIDVKGETPIFSAILKNQVDVVKLLIKKNANINVVNRFKDTPTYKSIALGKPEITELLLKRNGEFDFNKVVEKKCSKCHGMDGRSKAPFSPNLASMGKDYLVQQFMDYRNGARSHEKMDKRLTVGTSDSIVTMLADYYSQKPPIDLSTDAEIAAKGKILFNRENEIGESCASCHGQDGAAQNEESPRLASQNAEYNAIQLRAYRDGSRSNDSDEVMRKAAKALTDDEIVAIAGYLQSL